jgi:hypothetical protein
MRDDEEGAHQLQGALVYELIGAPRLLPPVKQVAAGGRLATGHGRIPDLFRKLNRSYSSCRQILMRSNEIYLQEDSILQNKEKEEQAVQAS